MRRRPHPLKSLARRLSVYLLPEALLYRAWRWHRARRPRSAQADASDHRHYPVQDGVRLEVYWVGATLGPGPGASLFVLGEEILRFDCFGGHGLTGHFHIGPQQVGLVPGTASARLFFPEGGYEDNIERAAFELERNAPAALAMNRDPSVRRVRLDQARLAKAASDMRASMLELLAEHGPPPATRTPG